MNKIYTAAFIIGLPFLLISFSTNPDDGNTGAPGENLCVQCHVQQNPSQNGTISIEGFPASITPNQTYMLTAVNRLTSGEAVRAGFQVTILSPINTRAGDFTNPSANSKVSITAGRQYWDHNPAQLYPDSNVVKWTVMWTAPDLPSGSKITWYAAGNIANGDFSNVGDRIVASNGSGTILLSGSDNPEAGTAKIYPNPGSDQINIELPDGNQPDGNIIFYSLLGERVSTAGMEGGIVRAPSLPTGLYLLELEHGNKKYFVRWTKI